MIINVKVQIEDAKHTNIYLFIYNIYGALKKKAFRECER